MVSLVTVCGVIMAIVMAPAVSVFLGCSVGTDEIWDRPEMFSGIWMRAVR